jgi:hypothetical protein
VHTAPTIPPLIALAYVSSATHDLSEAELERLLDSARRYNEQAQITGALLYHDGSFFQYLEGPAAEVDAAYARITASSQHRGLIRLMRRAIDRRQFDGWLMGFARVPHSLMLQLSQASWMQELAQVSGGSDLPAGIKLLLAHWETLARRG